MMMERRFRKKDYENISKPFLIAMLILLIFVLKFPNSFSQSHPANQIKPGVFQTGNYSFDGGLGIGINNIEEELTVNGSVLVKQYNLEEVGSITDSEVGGSASVLESTYGVFVRGSYAYVGSSGDNGLSIIDISDPNSPVEVGSITDDSVGGDASALQGANDVFVNGDFAYVTSSQDYGVSIIDISNPLNPLEVGSIKDTSAGGSATTLFWARGLFVSGGYLYALSSVEAAFEGGMSIIDISDPNSPVEVGSITDSEGSGSATSLETPMSIFVKDDYAYITSYLDNALTIIDVSDKTNPVEVGYIIDNSLSGDAECLSDPIGVFVRNSYAYVASNSDDCLSIIDVSNKSNPTEIGYIKDNGVGGSATVLDGARDVFVSGDYAYVTSDIDDGVAVIDISNPLNPVEVGSIRDNESGGSASTLEAPYKIFVSGGYIYTTSNSDNGLSILNMNGIDTPSADIGSLKVSNIDVESFAKFDQGVDIRGGLNVGSNGIKSNGDIIVSGLGDLVSSGSTNRFRIISDDFVEIKPEETRSVFLSKNSSIFYEDDGGTALLYLDNVGGAIGVGLSDPTSSLDVGGMIRSRRDNHQYVLYDISTSVDEWSISTYSNHGLAFMEHKTTPRMVLESGGEVGIGVGTPNDALDVVGNIDATGCVQTDDSGSIGGTCVSDKRLKENIQSLNGSLDKLVQLNPVSYEWKKEFYNISHESGAGVGIIAQELEKIFPELVKTDEKGYKRVRYDTELEMHVIQAIKELKIEKDYEIEQLVAKNSELESENILLKEAICEEFPDKVICKEFQ